jgi:hypothetical protein
MVIDGIYSNPLPVPGRRKKRKTKNVAWKEYVYFTP